jgi:hypothetical protein
MNRHRKSDRPICTVEAVEQKRVGFLLAEIVEGRCLTKGNLFQQNKFRTQYRKRSGRASKMGFDDLSGFRNNAFY